MGVSSDIFVVGVMYKPPKTGYKTFIATLET